MLKISVTDTRTEQKWVLQGRLTGACVSELWENWLKLRNARQGCRRVVDLNDVTFIDHCGETVLLEMMKEDVRFLASGVDTKQLLHDLRVKSKRPLRRCME
jgi:anti-anti-sigma regulatory factor